MPKRDTKVQPDMALAVLYRLDGGERFVDLEEIAYEAHQEHPLLFRWRLYDLPSVETIRMAFRHANENEREPLWIAGDGGRSRMLTAAGIRRVRSLSLTQAPKTAERPLSRELLRMERHPAVQIWERGGVPALSIGDVADLLNCGPDAEREVFVERIARARAISEEWQRQCLIEFLTAVSGGVDQLLEARS